MDVYQDFQGALHAGQIGAPLLPRYQLVWVAGNHGKPTLNATLLAEGIAQAKIADRDFELLGGGAADANVTVYAEGGITITTAGADGNGMFIAPHLDAEQTNWTGVTWGTDQQTRWECRFRTGTAAQIADCIIWAGLKLTNTDVVITDANQVYFRYEDLVTGGRWVAVNSIGGVDVATDTGWTVAAATDYHLLIDIDGQRRARFYINGILRATSAQLTNAIDLIPYICVEADGAAAAKVLHVRGQSISRTFA